MRKFFYFIIIVVVCGGFFACNREKTPEKDKQIYDCHQISEAYNAPLFSKSLENDSALKIVREIVCDTSYWWSMPIAHAGTALYDEKLRSDSIKISIAKEWCEKHATQCNDFFMGRIWTKQGGNEILIGEWEKAVVAFEKAYEHFVKTKAYRELTTSCINLAGTYYRCGNLSDAMEFYRKAAFVEDSLRIWTYYVAIQTGIAQVYVDLQNYIVAHQYLDSAQKYLEGAHVSEIYYYYVTRAVCYYYQQNYNLAYSNFSIALEYAKKIGLYQEIMCKVSLGEVALMNKEPDLAMSHIDDCMDFLADNQKMRNKTLKFYIASLSADVFMANGDWKRAKKLIDILPNPKEVKMMRYLSLHYYRLHTYAVGHGDYKRAYELLQVAHNYKDSISNLAAVNRIVEIGRRYQRDTTLLRQRFQLAHLEAKTSQHKMRIYVLISSLVILILGYTIAMKILRRRNEKRVEAQFEQISKLRMDVVRNRLSPHFVFNVLGMMLPKFKQNPELHQLSELFIDVLRGNLIASTQLSIEYTEEIRLVRQYVGLYHKSKSEYPVVIWHDATHEEANSIRVPTMCLLIPVENALKHAFPVQNEENRIDIYIMCEDNRLMMRIIDNGSGYNPGAVSSTGRDTGTGLRVLSRTISLLNEKNSRPIEFQVRNLSNDGIRGTEVKISIPFEYQYKL